MRGSYKFKVCCLSARCTYAFCVVSSGLYKVLVGRPEKERQLERPRRRWKDNIKMDLQEVGCGGMDSTDMSQVRERFRAPVNAVRNLRVP